MISDTTSFSVHANSKSSKTHEVKFIFSLSKNS